MAREALRDILIGKLIARFLHAGADTHRLQWNALLNVDKDSGGMGIRTRLKAKALEEVHKDAPVIFTKASLQLQASSLHQLLLIVICEAEGMLDKQLSTAAMQVVHSAYCTVEEFDAVDPALKKKSGVDRKKLLEAVVAIARAKRETGFARHDAASFAALAKGKK